MAHQDEEVKWVYDRMHGHCFYCGKPILLADYGRMSEKGSWFINRFIPGLGAQENQRDNWVPACARCDSMKGELLPWEYDRRRFRHDDGQPENYIV